MVKGKEREQNYSHSEEGDGHCEALGSMGFNRVESQCYGLGKLQRANVDPTPILSPKHLGILATW